MGISEWSALCAALLVACVLIDPIASLTMDVVTLCVMHVEECRVTEIDVGSAAPMPVIVQCVPHVAQAGVRNERCARGADR